jgi:VCBS repeat-containing protein
MILDSVNVSPATGPATESTAGSLSFSDAETGDTHSASFLPNGSGYVGTFSLDPVSEAGGTGSVAWHFTVDNADIQFLAQGQTLTQDYLVTIADNNGGSTTQDITVTIDGTNDAPTAVSETVITDVGTSATVEIPSWALTLNDTDPDATDHLALASITASSGGSGVQFGNAFFTEDATLGGSFNYTISDGTTTSSNAATATIINSAAGATALTGTGGDDILIATFSGNAMAGGSGNDSFAFLQQPTGVSTISDFNNTTEHDHIAISANGFGGGLTAGQDVSFETSGDGTFSGFAQFNFDTGNQTLYYSADGTQGSAAAVASVQAGVILNQHDILVV